MMNRSDNPDKLFVVTVECGAYSGFSIWIVAVFLKKQGALFYCKILNDWLKKKGIHADQTKEQRIYDKDLNWSEIYQEAKQYDANFDCCQIYGTEYCTTSVEKGEPLLDKFLKRNRKKGGDV